MGGKPFYVCSFCKKNFEYNADARDQHERECVMLEHGRYIPRDVPLPPFGEKT